MRSLFAVAALAVLFNLAGCAWLHAEKQIPKTPPVPPNPYATTDLADLMQFAGKFTVAAPEERLAESRKLKDLYLNDKGLGVRLRLLLAQAADGSPEELREAIALVDGALLETGDEGVRSFLIFEKSVLVRLDKEIRHCQALAKEATRSRVKEKKAHHRLRSKENALKSQERELKSQESELKSQESELKAVQEKLEALKAIEQSLDTPKKGP